LSQQAKANNTVDVKPLRAAVARAAANRSKVSQYETQAALLDVQDGVKNPYRTLA
jgi:hypothetical protein